jgi:hypothetical protein
MKQVTVRSALYYSNDISGTFPFVAVLPKDQWCKREVYLRIVRDGKTINVHANRADFDLLGGASDDTLTVTQQAEDFGKDLTDEELGAIIKKRFDIMETMTEGVVAGDIRSLIVSGAPGISKTHTLENRLRRAGEGAEINKWTHIKGKISPLSMYIALYEHSKKGQVILFDDVDSVFGDETPLNLLKSALDTGTRTISWLSTTKILEDADIPTTFTFEGACVFITNIDFDAKIEKGGADAEHYKALVSRSNYLDLRVHTKREVLIRVKQVVEGTKIISLLGLTDAQGKEIVDWLDVNYKNMREISIRSVLKLSNYMHSDANNWKDVAEVMLLRR